MPNKRMMGQLATNISMAAVSGDKGVLAVCLVVCSVGGPVQGIRVLQRMGHCGIAHLHGSFRGGKSAGRLITVSHCVCARFRCFSACVCHALAVVTGKGALPNRIVPLLCGLRCLAFL